MVAPDGTESSAGLSISPDGTLFAVYGPVPDAEDGAAPRVVHRDAAGDEIATPPG